MLLLLCLASTPRGLVLDSAWLDTDVCVRTAANEKSGIDATSALALSATQRQMSALFVFLVLTCLAAVYGDSHSKPVRTAARLAARATLRTAARARLLDIVRRC